MKTFASAAVAAALALGCGGFIAAYPVQDFDVLHYDVVLRPDFANGTISGTTRVRFRSQDKLTALRFSHADFLLNQAARFGIADMDYVSEIIPDGKDLLFGLPPLKAGRTFEYVFQYQGKLKGGQTLKPGLAYVEYFACEWMVCRQDAPGDKASLTLSLDLPRGMTAYGPGKLVSRTPLEGGLERQVWSETRPYSSYLFGFIAGDLKTATVHHGRTDLVYLSPTASPDQLKALFEPTGAMLDFFEAKAGAPLPHRRYVQLHVPGGAAQEAMNYAVLGDDVLTSRLKDPREDWAIAHELAHQWWGNAITCTDWDQFWLNEGITSFMVAAWKEHRWGRAAYDHEMELFRGRVKAAGIDAKLTSSYAGYKSLRERRAIQYSKGALFMDALRRELGDEAFWKAFKAYSRRHMGGVVTSADFQRDFERSSGRDLGALFAAWVS